MKTIFYEIGKNIVTCFKGRNFLWHLLAILSTYLIVTSGFDWTYFQFFTGTTLAYVLFSTAPVGGLVPILVPLTILLFGKLRKSTFLLVTGFALIQSVMLGSLISSFYKSLTGRSHPDLGNVLTENITNIFNFSFFGNGVFWGWPSSHTTIAFAMAFTLWALYPHNNKIKALTLLYAMYIGIGVSMTIHWFSDFTAGAIIGTVIGTVVGKSFKKKHEEMLRY